MKRQVQQAIVAVIGVIAIRTALSGQYLNFVKPGLKWWLILAGGVLLVIGVYGVLTDNDSERQPATGTNEADTILDEVPAGEPGLVAKDGIDVHARPDEHGHSHAAGGPRIGWLLLVPFLCLSVLVPPPLGAFSAERDSGAVRQTKSAQEESLPALPPGDAPVLSLGDYSVRAVYDKGATLKGRKVRMVGFVSSRARGKPSDAWYLTRIAISCCAGDGYAIKIDVGGGERLPDNTWVSVVGTWKRSAGSIDSPTTLAAFEIESMQETAKPAFPYE